MANRSSRKPGDLARFDANAFISTDVPSFAVNTGQAAEALAAVAGNLSAKLGQMADRAAKREGELAGLSAGQQAGAAYLQQQSTTNQAVASSAMVRAPGEIRKIISDAAVKYGVDPGDLLTIARLESSFNPRAKNPSSSAGGLFQFIDGTAADYKLADRYDAAQASDAAARLTRDNTAHLKGILGRQPSRGELYLAHQQGAGGAAKLLRDPNAKAVDVVGADAVRLNGGHPGMTAGEFANLWIRKAGDRTDQGAVEAGTPAERLSTEPLALRRDGTIRGESFDDAALTSWGWRMQEGISTDLFAAQLEHQDDPAGFAAAAQQIHKKYAGELPNDPQAREAFDQTFQKNTRAYGMNIAARHEAQLRQEQEASFSAGLSAKTVDIERQAQVLGASPEGDTIIREQVADLQRSIDGAVAQGIISPAQAEKEKEGIAKTAAFGRVQGVYEALPTAEAKEQFALELLEDWREGKGPMAALPFAEVKARSDVLFNQARAEINRRVASSKLEAAQLEDLVKDDVASIRVNGQGLDPARSGLTVDRLRTVGGDAAVAAWQAEQDQARRIYSATNGMETQTEADIAERLQVMAPKAGTAGFVDQAEIFELASKRAGEILKARANDPAAFVERNYPSVAELAEVADPQDPQSMQALVKARLNAQAALGIGELSRAPLTSTEARNLAQAVTLQADGGAQAKAMMQLVEQVGAVYGSHAESVLNQVLQAKGIDKKMAEGAARQFRRLAAGGAVTATEKRQNRVLDETGVSERQAVPTLGQKGRSENPLEVQPSASRLSSSVVPVKRPNLASIQYLQANPGLAAQFDEVYGEGASAEFLKSAGTPAK